jgi:hypothetical protein
VGKKVFGSWGISIQDIIGILYSDVCYSDTTFNIKYIMPSYFSFVLALLSSVAQVPVQSKLFTCVRPSRTWLRTPGLEKSSSFHSKINPEVSIPLRNFSSSEAA